MSFGLAGGLGAGLRPGDVVIPRVVLAGAQRYVADTVLSQRLGGFTHDLLYCGDRVLVTATDKAQLQRETNACAVDLESGPAAEEAARCGLPFAALRAVCDPAERTLPPAAVLALDTAGRIGMLRVASSVLCHPGQIADLVRLAGDAARARSALVRQLVVIARGTAAG